MIMMKFNMQIGESHKSALRHGRTIFTFQPLTSRRCWSYVAVENADEL